MKHFLSCECFVFSMRMPNWKATTGLFSRTCLTQLAFCWRKVLVFPLQYHHVSAEVSQLNLNEQATAGLARFSFAEVSAQSFSYYVERSALNSFMK